MVKRDSRVQGKEEEQEEGQVNRQKKVRFFWW
jgi:hypothetical protein